MPAIRGVTYTHPTTGESGLWVQKMDGTVLGRTTAQLADMAGVGSAAKKIERIRATAEAYLAIGMEQRTPQATFFADWTQGEIDTWKAAPPAFWRVDGTDVVAQLSVPTIEIITLSPLVVQITISNGASGVQVVYRN